MSNKKIWKQDISIQALDAQSRILLRLPVGANIVHVGNQGDPTLVTFWFEFYGSHLISGPQMVDRELYVFGTDHPIPVGLQHVGSTLAGMFVWHLYERPVRG